MRLLLLTFQSVRTALSEQLKPEDSLNKLFATLRFQSTRIIRTLEAGQLVVTQIDRLQYRVFESNLLEHIAATFQNTQLLTFIQFDSPGQLIVRKINLLEIGEESGNRKLSQLVVRAIQFPHIREIDIFHTFKGLNTQTFDIDLGDRLDLGFVELTVPVLIESQQISLIRFVFDVSDSSGPAS